MNVIDNSIRTLIKVDLRPVRFLIAMSSLMWAAFALFPGNLFKIQEFCSVYFNNPDILNWLIFSENLWAFLFLFHSIVIFYSLWAEKPNKLFTLIADGIVGSFIWSFSIGIYLLSLLVLCPSSVTVLASGLVITLAQWWSLVIHAATFQRIRN
jgi:hypothetical protein